QGEQFLIGRKGAAGDILVYFFDAHGELIRDITFLNEFIGLKLKSLSTNLTVIGVDGVEQKAEAIIDAMRGNYINAHATDQKT
ncbi:sugar-binding domain-containing protein, partial [Salmonella enterica]|uniref:sugar-binding domain-containing protein n=1 Tax=Salmonella enterica TaxID=28901 RepID=UPI000A6B4ADE